MTPWIALALSASTTLVVVGVAFGMLRSRAENNSILIRELRDHLMQQVSSLKEKVVADVEEVKLTKASTERLDAIVDRLDRFEENIQSRFDDLKESIRELTAQTRRLDE